jgi:hypothetical protein
MGHISEAWTNLALSQREFRDGLLDVVRARSSQKSSDSSKEFNARNRTRENFRGRICRHPR